MSADGMPLETRILSARFWGPFELRGGAIWLVLLVHGRPHDGEPWLASQGADSVTPEAGLGDVGSEHCYGRRLGVKKTH